MYFKKRFALHLKQNRKKQNETKEITEPNTKVLCM